MITSKTFNLLLSILFVSSLVFSCKTTRTPRIVTNQPGGSDSIKKEDEFNNESEKKIVQFHIEKDSLNKIDKTILDSGYRYSVKSSSYSSSCSSISETQSNFKTIGSTAHLDDIPLKFPCNYTFNIILLKKNSSGVLAQAYTVQPIEMSISSSDGATIQKELELKKSTTPPGGAQQTPPEDGSVNVQIIPILQQ